MKRKALAFIRPNGDFEIDSNWNSEADIWKEKEALDKRRSKQAGYRVVEVEVEIPE